MQTGKYKHKIELKWDSQAIFEVIFYQIVMDS